MNIGPDDIKDSRLPIGSVSWNEAVTYFKTIGGRLPTEIEWEYAARAGTTAKQYGLADAIAWHSGNSRSLLHPVGLKQANAFGLFDMLGNVAEWTADDYDSGHKVVRGGTAKSRSDEDLTASSRVWFAPTDMYTLVGFRCVGP